jgi:hypothetical protein
MTYNRVITAPHELHFYAVYLMAETAFKAQNHKDPTAI